MLTRNVYTGTGNNFFVIFSLKTNLKKYLAANTINHTDDNEVTKYL